MPVDVYKSRQQSSSSALFDYLTPRSKKMRIQNMRKEINTLKATLKHELYSLKLNYDQSLEISKLVSSISNFEAHL